MRSGKSIHDEVEDRDYWLEQLDAIGGPVLEALAERRLKLSMPIETSSGNAESTVERGKYSHLEAFGRLLSGIAPWLENGERYGAEGELRERYVELSRTCLDAATDPDSPDYMNFGDGFQPIVDAAFLAQALLRAPNELLRALEPRVKANVVNALKLTRSRKPVFSNWLLFAATIESALCLLGESDWDHMRVDYALKQHEQWYLGDGVYGDGPEFHFDYYNSFVIQPMLVDVMAAVGDTYEEWSAMRDSIHTRARRFAEVQERLIAPDGSYPPIGRSLAYRFGAFQSLAQSALRDDLPSGLDPAQVRSALTAVIRRTLELPGNFTADGWLTIGFCGHQPGVGEHYISTGSLYLSATVFLPLGLPDAHPFWSGAQRDWTSRKAWSGMPFPIDKAIK
ncbi:DUF2264 domain-containing protein [Paenibacillus harenae]|uniref:DUF2264 domain-containing protein n=1 Tax=Paenibacillus harenae TaxID=306543 RepID=A0ABT9U7U3_PAEHA|nr:DUF2264 domain-containing protein [Paenibacillus harenae]MDQ0115702.1 hypothetical protein [Paenibacillus harenae]